jgi:hypothetical protein
MFERDPREEKALTDYTGLKIGAILLPMLLLFIYFGKAGANALHCLSGEHGCHQNPMEPEETSLVLADYCFHICAPCSIIFYHSPA